MMKHASFAFAWPQKPRGQGSGWHSRERRSLTRLIVPHFHLHNVAVVNRASMTLVHYGASDGSSE